MADRLEGPDARPTQANERRDECCDSVIVGDSYNESIGQTREQRVGLHDLDRLLPIDRQRQSLDRRPEVLSDELVPETDAEHRHLCGVKDLGVDGHRSELL